MWAARKRIFISNFAGLADRLETLVLAAMIENQFGHRIVLDWPEGDSLRVAGTDVGRLMPWQRIGAKKIRDFGRADLEAIGRHARISLRATYGPDDMQQRYLLPTAARLRPHRRVVETVVNGFDRLRSRRIVGVHIRHGDFHLTDGDTYDARSLRHPAVPLWWYEQVMSMFVRHDANVCFLLCFSGDSSNMHSLRDKFDVVTLPKALDYQPMQAGHASTGHPVIDLFGLACCSTLIASPTSSFSHWAANMLGPETTSIIPPPVARRPHPAQNAVRLHGRILRDWRAAAEQGAFATPIADVDSLPRSQPAQFDWLLKNSLDA